MLTPIVTTKTVSLRFRGQVCVTMTAEWKLQATLSIVASNTSVRSLTSWTVGLSLVSIEPTSSNFLLLLLLLEKTAARSLLQRGQKYLYRLWLFVGNFLQLGTGSNKRRQKVARCCFGRDEALDCRFLCIHE